VEVEARLRAAVPAPDQRLLKDLLAAIEKAAAPPHADTTSKRSRPDAP
jgi:hypothetical protein